MVMLTLDHMLRLVMLKSAAEEIEVTVTAVLAWLFAPREIKKIENWAPLAYWSFNDWTVTRQWPASWCRDCQQSVSYSASMPAAAAAATLPAISPNSTMPTSSVTSAINSRRALYPRFHYADFPETSPPGEVTSRHGFVADLSLTSRESRHSGIWALRCDSYWL